MRKCDFETRRNHLASLTDQELEERFWKLTEQIVTPLLEIAERNTSPSIERSVLMRMGFNSLEAKVIVDKCLEHGLLGKGAGHAVWKLAKLNEVTIEEAGEMLLADNGWDALKAYFLGGELHDHVS